VRRFLCTKCSNSKAMADNEVKFLMLLALFSVYGIYLNLLVDLSSL